MRHVGLALLVPFLLLTTAVKAGTCPDPATSAQHALVVGTFDSGTLLTARLVSKVSAQPPWYHSIGFVPTAKVIAWIDYDLVCNGQTVIPKGSELAGMVIEGNLRDSTHPSSKMRILFDKLQLRGRRAGYIEGRIVAVAASNAPLDVTSIGVSGLSSLELNTDDGTLASSVERNVSLPADTQIVVLIDNPPPAQKFSVDALTGCTAGAALAPGMNLMVRLNKEIKSARAKPGDLVTARTIGAKRCFGKNIAPADSRIIGHISEVKRAIQSGDESRLGIVFDKIRLSGNREIQIEGMLEAINVATATVYECQWVSDSDLSNTTRTQYCGWSSERSYVENSHLRLDKTRSVISSDILNIELHPADELILKITAVK